MLPDSPCYPLAVASSRPNTGHSLPIIDVAGFSGTVTQSPVLRSEYRRPSHPTRRRCPRECIHTDGGGEHMT